MMTEQTPYTDRKGYARELDRAAERARFVDRIPATGKQCWYLAGLMMEAGESPEDWGMGCIHTTSILTKSQASRMISDYLND